MSHTISIRTANNRNKTIVEIYMTPIGRKKMAANHLGILP